MKVAALFIVVFFALLSLCDLSGINELRWGKRLTNPLIDTVFRVSYLECIKECVSRKRCQSVNYQRKHLLCDLNYLYSIPFQNASSDVLGSLVDDDSFVFSDISSWDKRIAGSCSSQPCAENGKCIHESFKQHICEVSDCGPLQNEGTEILTNASTVKIGVGARRTFTCTTGYEPYNLTTMLSCTSDGAWQGFHCTDCRSGCFVPASPQLFTNDIYITYIGENLLTIPPLSFADHSWRVIQKRIDGTELFFRSWSDYVVGFGSINHEFWIGNDNLHFLTSNGYTHLRIDLEDNDGNTRYAEYTTFEISEESTKYRLTVGGYSGNAGDSMANHNGLYFSTYDKDNDRSGPRNCAEVCKGGWWYKFCGQSNLNGEYGNTRFQEGINWNTWHGFTYSLKSVTMAIRKP